MMDGKEKILSPAGRIRGGVTLPHLKGTADSETIVIPPPETVRIPMRQHIGAPAEPVVSTGDKVFVGTLIGKAGGYVSAPVHSSVSGTVKGIEEYSVGGQSCKCVVIESDGLMEPDPSLSSFNAETRADIAEACDKCGLVGLGGAGFPTKVKLSYSDDTKIDTLIINGAECEPYITSDYRACIEDYEDVVDGLLSRDAYTAQKARLVEQRDDAHRAETEIQAEIFEQARDRSIYMERYQLYDDMEVLPDDAIADLLDRVTVWPDGRLEISLKFLDELSVSPGSEQGMKAAE